jgi:hypothetical protein
MDHRFLSLTALGMSMTLDERHKFVSILARLASDFDGERAAAGLLGTRMLQSKGLAWADLIVQPKISAPGRMGMSEPPTNGWHSELAICTRHIAMLTPWERTFIAGLQHSRLKSVKQRAILAKIAAKVRGV